MNRSIGYTLAIVLFGAGCASVPQAPAGNPTQASVTESETGGSFRLSQQSGSVSIAVDAPPERVWSVLPAVYSKLGVTPEFEIQATRTIGARGFSQSRLGGRRASDWVRCGNQGSGPSSGGMYRTRLSITTTVKDAGNAGSNLITEVSGYATAVEGTSTGPVACSSTGDLEQRIRALVEEQIARKL